MSHPTQRLLFALPAAWAPDDTEELLNLEPLPAGFKWRLTKSTAYAERGALADVQPSHRDLKYGKWLRDTPYFQGLFELVHQVVVDAGEKLPTALEIAAKLDQIRAGNEADKLPPLASLIP